ncbi:histone-lysine N-methyltransferase SMYD3-like [Varroa destructor]|uniref:SET domain-containing protein n=1 Tax=Varroa destructor TaxID=109461 RepID=A0A7M7IZC6_VARDE|nr:histone-lysine N-methyltransferase SMYD3-like [Varroa destructor]
MFLCAGFLFIISVFLGYLLRVFAVVAFFGRGLIVLQVADWADHKAECANLKRVAPRRPLEPARLMARLVLRWKRELEDPTCETLLGNRRRLKDCMDHRERIKMDRDRAKGFIWLLSLLKQFLSGPQLERVADIDILNLFGIMCINTMHVADDDGPLGCGLYLAASMIDHSCNPNVSGSFRGRILQLMPLREFEASSVADLSLSYITLHTTRERRRAELNKCYYFMCECEMCSGAIPEVMTEADSKLTDRVFELRDLTLDMSSEENPKRALCALKELFAGELANLEDNDVAKFTAQLTAADASVATADYALARDYYLSLLPVLKKVYSENHPQYAHKLVRLCRLMIVTTKQSRDVEEVSRLLMLLRTAVHIARQALGENHFDTKDVTALYLEMEASLRKGANSHSSSSASVQPRFANNDGGDADSTVLAGAALGREQQETSSGIVTTSAGSEVISLAVAKPIEDIPPYENIPEAECINE